MKNRKTDFFNLGWRFQKAGAEQWQTVNLPHDAMLFEKRDKNCHNGRHTGYFPGGKYNYEKTFSLTEEECGKELSVLFEGVYRNCTVSLNGEELCAHMYGYTEFSVTLTGKARAGENTLSVMVDNSLEPNSRWYSGSGIYRPVQFLIREPGAPKRLRVRTQSVSPARIAVESETNNTITVGYEGKTILQTTATGECTYIDIPEAKLWCAEQPNLYTITVANDKGELTDIFGIRHLSWDAKNGFCINGTRVLLRGGCIHHDNGVLGACEFSDAAERRVRILKEAGYNAIRSAHNPMSRELLAACDRQGMYVMDEGFDGWYKPKTHHDNGRTFDDFWRQDLKSMVDKDYNHPCVVMYSIGNEVTETATEKGVACCGELKDYVHGLDPTRPVTCAVNLVLNLYWSERKEVYDKGSPYKPEPLPPKAEGYIEKATGSTLYNQMAAKFGPLMFFLSSGKKAEKEAAGIAAQLDVLGINYGASRFKEDLVKYPDRLMVASETLASDLPYNWKYVKKYPSVLGDFVWTAWDYLGEASIGDFAYVSYKGLPKLSGCGNIDITGLVTAQTYFSQIIWGLRKEPFIGVSPMNHAGEESNNGRWRFTNVLDSWSWDGCEGKTATIEVYSDAKFIRLELNGKRIGVKPVHKYTAKFKCAYSPGTLTAVALDGALREVNRSSLVSAGKETVLKAVPETKDLKADGVSLCYIPIEFTDTAGVLKPEVEELVTVEVEGPAVLAGFGSALAKTDESFTENSYHSYRGRVLAVLRSTTECGMISVRVRTESGKEETVCLQAV